MSFDTTFDFDIIISETKNKIYYNIDSLKKLIDHQDFIITINQIIQQKIYLDQINEILNLDQNKKDMLYLFYRILDHSNIMRYMHFIIQHYNKILIDTDLIAIINHPNIFCDTNHELVWQIYKKIM